MVNAEEAHKSTRKQKSADGLKPNGFQPVLTLRPTTSEIAYWTQRLRESGFVDIDCYDSSGWQTTYIPSERQSRYQHKKQCAESTKLAFWHYLHHGAFEGSYRKRVWALYVRGRKIDWIARKLGKQREEIYWIIHRYTKICLIKYEIPGTYHVPY